MSGIQKHSHNFQDLTGQKYGRLTVVSLYGSDRKKTLWNCRCECGRESVVDAANLKSGNTKSCGCLNVEKWGTNSYRHGGCKERLYRVYANMKDRCYCATNRQYRRYGGRGITMCDEWRRSYLPFKSWAIENGYDENAARGQCTLDRIDNDGPYAPWNCRWVTQKEQCDNKSTNRVITYHGESKPLSKWCEELGLSYGTVWARICKYGYSVEMAFEKE